MHRPRIGVAGLAIVVSIGLLTGCGSSSSGSSTSTPTGKATTLSPTTAAAILADGKTWQSGLHKYLALAPRCFTRTGGQFNGCMKVALRKWSVPFMKARHDARAAALTVTGACRERLLDYLGQGGSGDALVTTMGFVQKDALKRKLQLLESTFNQLMLPAYKDTAKAPTQQREPADQGAGPNIPAAMR